MTRHFTPVQLPGNDGVPRVVGQAAAQAVAHGQDLIEPNPFAPLRQNNKVRCFTTGEEYFGALSKQMKDAKKCIFIAGWQVNWDVELTPGERLIDILHERIKKSDAFRVFVMPWMSPKIGLNTFDLETMLAIFQLNAGCKTMQAMCCPAGPQSDYIGTEGAAFSHHQKLIVIDNEYAYIGGMDLAYGRRDNNKFSLNPGKRRFQERYNPGVPGSDAIKAGMGDSLTMMELLSTTLSAGKWNKGGNSDPGAISKFIDSRMEDAKRFALGAVDLVNKGAKIQLDARNALISAEISGLKAGVAGVKAGVNVSADAVVASAKAVSSSCAASQLPDFFGGLKIDNIGAEPTSGLPNAIRSVETGAIKDANGAIVAVAGLADFLAPLKRLQISPTAHSFAADAVAGGERLGRAGANTFINVEAAMAGTAQHVAESGKQVCVQIGPTVEHGVVRGKAAIKTGVDRASAAVHSAAAAIEQDVNVFQREIIDGINSLRATINSKYFTLVALGDRTLDEAISGMSQADLQGIIEHLMRFAKLVYAAQLALAWDKAAAHPLLFNKGTKAATGAVLGPTQPREPWQDVHSEIKGPAVDDVARNFIDRWNALQKSYLSEQTLKDMGPGMRSLFESRPGFVSADLLIPAHLVPATRPPQGAQQPTGVAVRVLRSAPRKLCQQEAQARGERTVPAQEQREIQTQMVNLIRGATDFVYIENQFFQTGFGKPSINVFSPDGRKLTSGPMKFMEANPMNQIKSELSSAGNANGKELLPDNEIGRALGDRIAQAVRRDLPFHVYMVLPVHPEGRLDDITVVGQIHWTMQSLVFAEYSLINRVRRAIAARKLCKNPLSKDAWTKALEDAGARTDDKAPYERVSEAQWSRYLTLLNLRTCEKIGGVVRTEQIYVHSKLLIVDDRHVVLGSANINDRSQSGKRDSEIAVMLFENKAIRKPLAEATTHVNELARTLRINIWRKHFALDRKLDSSEKDNSIVMAATEMEAVLELPAAEATVNAIQKLARRNAGIYVETFPHVPWSKTNEDGSETGASIWPVCPKGASAEQAAKCANLMPFHEDFWVAQKVPVKAPSGIKGFFTKLPTNWTIGENNHPGKLSVLVLSQNDKNNPNSSATLGGQDTAKV